MLEDVLALFMQRYGLTKPDDSAGCKAIQGAMRGEVTIRQLRRVLTEQYNLYPHYESLIVAALDAIGDVPVAAAESDIPAVDEEVAATVPRRRRSKT